MDTPYNLDEFGFSTVAPMVRYLTQIPHDQIERNTASLATKSNRNPILLTASPTKAKKSIKNTIAVESVIISGLLIKERIGKKGLMSPKIYSHNHTAASLLQTYATQGCPVDCGKIWSKDLIEVALLHGPHKSARSPEARTAL